ncbi:hypothetical protein OEA41_004282 [Lepraria neglecta]|uniref:Cyclin-domain-containing protein n=1 Tax=Lepraria neglecta TaxID=209136 RepID=A0AAD9YXL7_9LECA|nr:hypothetical protein OEA41_004282 [Lepraria neglecta]
MVVGDVNQASSTRSEPFHYPSHASHLRNDSSTGPSPRGAQATPSIAAPPSQDAPHIRFRGAPPQDPPQQTNDHLYDHGNHLLPEDPHSATESAMPPPSPRLEPTHRSTLSLNGSVANSPSRIKVRDLGHIQSFASEEVLTRSRHPSRHSLRGRLAGGQQYEISSMPVGDIIEMVAGLLTKITTTNDRQHEYLHRNIPPPEGNSGLSSQASSVLAFHGKNVPSITIASYLSRIHKYCPTTYEVFLSLLVYFDRMTEMVNSGSLSTFPGDDRPENEARREPRSSGSTTSSVTAANSSPGATPAGYSPRAPTIVSPEGSDSSESPEMRPSSSVPPTLTDADAYDLSHFFVVDSFNIHRLVIAGVTCASKFFSDVFYTNSRYAKVGGLPLNELNHLELQFLLLNDFRLSVPIEELDAYGTMLVEFYAREVLAQQQGHQTPEGLYMAA